MMFRVMVRRWLGRLDSNLRHGNIQTPRDFFDQLSLCGSIVGARQELFLAGACSPNHQRPIPQRELPRLDATSTAASKAALAIAMLDEVEMTHLMCCCDRSHSSTRNGSRGGMSWSFGSASSRKSASAYKGADEVLQALPVAAQTSLPVHGFFEWTAITGLKSEACSTRRSTGEWLRTFASDGLVPAATREQTGDPCRPSENTYRRPDNSAAAIPNSLALAIS